MGDHSGRRRHIGNRHYIVADGDQPERMDIQLSEPLTEVCDNIRMEAIRIRDDHRAGGRP